MHPDISNIVSSTFYDKKIINYDQIMRLIDNPDIYSNKVFLPISFYDIKVIFFKHFIDICNK